MLVAIIWWICVISFIYIGIARAIFHFCAKKDLFDEIDCWLKGDFPITTFLVSAFWIFAIPLLLISSGILWIGEEITTSYQAIYEIERERVHEKVREVDNAMLELEKKVEDREKKKSKEDLHK